MLHYSFACLFITVTLGIAPVNEATTDGRIYTNPDNLSFVLLNFLRLYFIFFQKLTEEWLKMYAISAFSPYHSVMGYSLLTIAFITMAFSFLYLARGILLFKRNFINILLVKISRNQTLVAEHFDIPLRTKTLKALRGGFVGFFLFFIFSIAYYHFASATMLVLAANEHRNQGQHTVEVAQKISRDKMVSVFQGYRNSLDKSYVDMATGELKDKNIFFLYNKSVAESDIILGAPISYASSISRPTVFTDR